MSIFNFAQLNEAGASAKFETNQNKTDTPTLALLDFRIMTGSVGANLKAGLIHRIHFRLNPTNAVTYTLRIWQAAIAADYESNMNMLYESPAARADDTDYDVAELVIPFILANTGMIYYSVEWTGAPGITTGFLAVSGVAH
jgi:hypothetical protein